jgi:ribosomal protein S18 acetylase RimI-like enzyme
LVDVRAPTIEDIPAIRAFLLKAWSEAGPDALGWTGASEEVIREISTEEFLRGLLSDQAVHVRVALSEKEILGFSVVRGEPGGTRELAGLIVRERETGKGVGRELLHRVLAEARRDGVDSLVVKTEAFNERALGFYVHEGFVEKGRIEETVGGKKVALVILECRLRTMLS